MAEANADAEKRARKGKLRKNSETKNKIPEAGDIKKTFADDDVV